MGKEKPEEIEEKVRSYLGLNHRLVGTKISEESIDGEYPAIPMTFCRAVRETLGGKELVIGIEMISVAPTPSCALGFGSPRSLTWGRG